ncbi:MAG: MmcQ/YjbR family DNA-binding protein [Acidobacteriota bacterium]
MAREPLSQNLQDHCRSLPAVTEDIKWGNNLVFSVGDKMFAIFDTEQGEALSFKVDEEAFDMLTNQSGMRPAPYLARHLWVTADRPDALPLEFLQELLEESHLLVAAKLPRSKRAKLGLD